MNSTHICEVFQIIEILPHTNADSLEIIVQDGYPSCVRKGQFKVGDLAIFIPPDNVVDVNRSEFQFLRKSETDTLPKRITAKKLRGQVSFGLIIPAPGMNIGDNAAEILGITHWEPDMECGNTQNDTIPGPPGFFLPKYDLESLRKYKKSLSGCNVSVFEKVHGQNIAIVNINNILWVRGRTQWHAESDNIYWRAIRNTPSIVQFCMDNPETVIFGEQYGHNKGFNYDASKDKPMIRVFDIWKHGRFFSMQDFINLPIDIPLVPCLGHNIPYDFDVIAKMAEGPSLINGSKNIREGIVVRPPQEGIDNWGNRMVYKLVGVGYLTGK